jgi:hypothetical protein
LRSPGRGQRHRRLNVEFSFSGSFLNFQLSIP